jgi:ATP-dependent Clp protease ATP-binding subunit ClpC
MIRERAPFSHLDNRAKRVLGLARQQAEDRHSEGIAPAHVLLALLAVRRGLAARAVAGICGSCARAEDSIAEVLPAGRRPSPAHVPFTAATEEAMVRAAQQAQLLGDDHIGTEHLLLGVLASPDNAAVGKLEKLGVDYDGVRTEIGRLRAG